MGAAMVNNIDFRKQGMDKQKAIRLWLQLDTPTPYEKWDAAGRWLASFGPEPYKSQARKILKISAPVAAGPAVIIPFPVKSRSDQK